MSKIEWTDQTLNPAVGCSPMSPACDNCYAVRMATRLAANPKTALRYDGVVADGGLPGATAPTSCTRTGPCGPWGREAQTAKASGHAPVSGKRKPDTFSTAVNGGSFRRPNFYDLFAFR